MNMLENKSDFKDFSNEEIYTLLFEDFRPEELKYILKKSGITQKDFLNRMGYRTAHSIIRLVAINKTKLSSKKIDIYPQWVEFLRNEVGDEKLLILRSKFKKTDEYKEMKKNDKYIDERLMDGMINVDEDDFDDFEN